MIDAFGMIDDRHSGVYRYSLFTVLFLYLVVMATNNNGDNERQGGYEGEVNDTIEVLQ
jgi:hypothetical protein